MLTNEHFALSAEQLARYNEWAAARSLEHAEADAYESFAIEVTFTFSPLGREVRVSVAGSGQALAL
jgi:hypothetical protein